MSKFASRVDSKVFKTLEDWPKVGRLKIRHLLLGTIWGGIFLFPTIYGQYCYKTRTGLSQIQFDNSKTSFRELYNNKKTDDYLNLLKVETKPDQV